MNEVPFSTKVIAKLLQAFIGLFEFDSIALYVKDNSPYGVVWLEGNTLSLVHGIHAMIRDIAVNNDKTEAEVIQMIQIAKQKNM